MILEENANCMDCGDGCFKMTTALEPTRDRHATLVDLLDRILDKGLVINADIIVSVAGIPLLGVNLRAALAGVETMLKYGVMKDWDERTRSFARKQVWKKEPPLADGEHVLIRMFGSHYYSKGIYNAWRTGYFYLTNERLLLFRSEPAEVLLETALEKIRGLAVKREKHFAGNERDLLYVSLKTNEVAILHAENTAELRRAIEEILEARGLNLEKTDVLPPLNEKTFDFLVEGETVARSERVWYLCPAVESTSPATWKPGLLHLTNKRLCWRSEFDCKLLFQIATSQIEMIVVETGDLGVLKKKTVLTVSYKNAKGVSTATFSGEEKKLREWERCLRENASRYDAASLKQELETRLRCNEKSRVQELLKEERRVCEWMSPGPKVKALTPPAEAA